ncbi:MAG: response regulator [Candidatus Sericytochromatia bacterium]|nr:response regulator [Candidatus Sericytochromatia bacterium]
MPTPPEALPTILLVDDVPENLRVLADLLLQHGLSPRPTTSAKGALRLLETLPVDLILLDVNMPEMSGFELCSHLKQDPRFADIPVIFLSAAHETDHKVQAFQRGGVDYITKPFQFEEVRARVQTHLRLRRLQREQVQLLDRTLGGLVRTLVECLQLASPSAFARASAVRACVEHLTSEMPAEQRWAIRMAGTLAYVGCLALPDEVVLDAFTAPRQDPEQEARFARHAELGAQLLAEIPRLEDVARIVGAQLVGSLPLDNHSVALGIRILRLAQAYCGELAAGNEPAAALAMLRRRQPADAEHLERLAGFRATPGDDAPIEGSVADLSDGAVLVRPVRSVEGALVLAEGLELTPVLRYRLSEYVRSRRVPDTFLFRRPPTGT